MSLFSSHHKSPSLGEAGAVVEISTVGESASIACKVPRGVMYFSSVAPSSASA
jgi:hypothetical protein